MSPMDLSNLDDGFVVTVDSLPIEGFDSTTGQMATVVVFQGVTESDDGEEVVTIRFGVDHRMALDIIQAVTQEDEDGGRVAMCYVEKWQVLS